MKEEDPEQHVDERRDVVAEAGLNDEPGVHRVDVEEPVDCDQAGCDRIQTDDSARDRSKGCATVLRSPTTSSEHGDQDDQHRERPDDPVTKHLNRGHVLE
jgi:hypothetical protein